MSKITEQTAFSNQRLLTVYLEIQLLRQQVDSQNLYLCHKVQELQEMEQELKTTNHELYTALSEDASSP